MGLGFDELLGLGSEFSGQFRVLQEGEESGLEAFRRIDAEGASEFDHFFGFQCIVITLAEEDGQTHRGRFHGVMNAGGESRTDVGDVGSTVEPCEQADGVDEQDPQSRRGLVPVFPADHGDAPEKGFGMEEVFFGGFMGDEHQLQFRRLLKSLS